ncbi:MAG: DUF2855 family protein [Jiangellales bacterium]
MELNTRCLEVRRDDLHTTRVVDEAAPEVAAGQVLLAVERFGLTSNNVTYGVLGDRLGYWGFFPSTDGWGRIPAWGFAEVVVSEVAGVEVGTRVFGYLPMGTHLVVEPTHVSERGFTDGAAHRANLPRVYNSYQTTEHDPLYAADAEDVEVVFAPLFITSFVLADLVADNDDFGAGQVVLTSASSKTAAGTALCLKAREGRLPRVVGLTSPRHVHYVRRLGCYDEVIAYPDLATLDATTGAVLIDVAGNADVRAGVHRAFGDQLRHSATVGLAHWDAAPPTPAALPGPTPTTFFAPSQIDKRLREWGPGGYQQRLAAAWAELRGVVDGWVRVRTVTGMDAVELAYCSLLDGAVPPDEVLVVVPVAPND